MNIMCSTAPRNTTQASAHESCVRCSGHMAQEVCTDFESDCGYSTFWALRCIQCGDIVDEVILRNRTLFHPKTILAVAAAV